MEWQIVGVIVTLVGFLAVILPPIVKLNSSITKLNITMEHIRGVVAGSAAIKNYTSENT